MWLPLAAITVATLCVVAVSGESVRQPTVLNVHEDDVIGVEKGPDKKSTDDAPDMNILPEPKKNKPKGIAGRIRAALHKKMAAMEERGVHSGSGKLHRLADQMVGFVKSHLSRDSFAKMVVDIPDTADQSEPQKKLFDLGKNHKHNWLDNVFKDTKGEE